MTQFPGECDCSRRAILAMVAAGAAWPWLPGCHREPASAAAADSATGAPARPVLAPLPRTEPTVRVRIHRSERRIAIGRPHQWLRIRREPPKPALAGAVTGPPPLPVGDPNAAEPPTFVDAGTIAKGPVTIRIDKGKWRITDANGFHPYSAGLEPIWFAAAVDTEVDADPTRDPSLALNDHPYPGVFRIAGRPRRGPRAFDVINHVSLEAYLPGVVSGELFSHWHRQTHMAQAVAARSFAAAEAAWYARRRDYDLTNTQRSQMYLGAGVDRKATEAVRDTRGILLAWQRGLVPGYYSACCGGLAAAASDVIGDHPVNAVPPLAGRSGLDVCTDASVYERSVTISRAKIAARLAAWGQKKSRDDLADLTTVHSIQVASRNAHGRPTAYQIIADDPQTPILIAATQLQRALNASDAIAVTSSPVLRSSFCTFEFDDPSPSAAPAATDVTIANRGFGHGAGMCQYGAEQLARVGKTWRDILNWYYPEVELRAAYG